MRFSNFFAARTWALAILWMPLFSWAEAPSPQEIDALVQKTLTEWQIPGLALAIVHNGEQRTVSGYGVRERGRPELVDEKTLFQVCSLTKAFTSASIAILVKEGKLEWERPIKEYLPTFTLKDPCATQAMTLRDLLSGRTGLPGISKQEWRLRFNTGRSEEELIERLKEVDPAYPFRSHFSYNNMAYIVASKIVEKVIGSSWTKFCHDRLFSPLEMKRTYTSHNQIRYSR